MSIPTEVIMKMATIGLSEEQAKAVADMLTAVENATATTYEAAIEAGKEKGRDRWRKWKSTKTNVSKRLQTTANVSQQLTGVEDKTLTSVKVEEKKESKVRACRLPTDFAPDVSWAVSQGLSPSQADAEAAKFRDYWSSKGANATKTDWSATWRNWVRSALERQPTARGSPQPAISQADVFAMIAKAPSHEDQPEPPEDRSSLRPAISYLSAVRSG